MEDNLYKLNEIMKPFFEKKEYIKTLKNNINTIKLRLEKLFEAKQQAIKNYNNHNSYFYESMIKKDLDQSYRNEEHKLKEKLHDLENLYHLEISNLTEISINLKNKLILEQNRLKDKLKQEQINNDSVTRQLSNFKYEYNDQSQVINGDDWRNLYQKNIDNSKTVTELTSALEKVGEYLNLVELVKQQNPLTQNNVTLEKEGSNNVDSLTAIYNNIIKELEKLSNDSTDKKSIKLPCGEYFNENDINNVIDNLYSKDKGKIYVVEETGKEYKISKETIDEISQQLKNSATYILVKNKKISQIDLFKVFGKEKAKEIVKEVETKNIDNSKYAEGNYILKNDIIKILDKVFNVQKEKQVEENLNTSKQDIMELNNVYRIK